MMKSDVQDMAASLQSFVVLFKAEDVGLFPVAVPVTADTLEDCRAVMNAVSHNPNLGFFKRDDLILIVGI